MGAIRLYLAMAVVFWHIPGSPVRLLNAAVAVVLFFIVSGFYMAMVINEKYAVGDAPGWIRNFYYARIWRLYPAYLVMLIIMTVWFAGTDGPSPFLGRLDMPWGQQLALAFANLFIIGQDWHQFLTRVLTEQAGPPGLLAFVQRIGPRVLDDHMMAIGQAWSLASEFSFYALAPFIVRCPRRTAAALIVALLIRLFLLQGLDQRSGIWGYYFFPGSACMFLLGSAAYHLRQALPWKQAHRQIGYVALGAFAAWVAYGLAQGRALLESPASWSIDLPRFWLLYLSFTLAVPFMFEASRRWRIDREIGELSYPLYLVHSLVVGLIFFRWQGVRGTVWDAMAAALLSLLCAYVMRRLVEVPTDRWRQQRFVLRTVSGAAKLQMPTAGKGEESRTPDQAVLSEK